MAQAQFFSLGRIKLWSTKNLKTNNMILATGCQLSHFPRLNSQSIQYWDKHVEFKYNTFIIS